MTEQKTPWQEPTWTQPGFTPPTPDSPSNQPSSPGTPQSQPQPSWGPGQPAPGFQPWSTAPQPGVIPLRPLSLGDLIEGTFRSIRANPGIMFGFAIVVMIIAGAISAIVDYVLFSTLDISFDQSFASEENTTNEELAKYIVGVLGSSGSSVITLTIATTILGGISAYTVSKAVLGEKITLEEAWNGAKAHLWAIFGATLLVGLISFVTWGLVIALVSLLVMAASPSVSIVVIPILLIVAAIVTVYITIRFLFATSIVVLENTGAVASLKRSWKLTSGAFWQTFGRFLIISILTGIASGVVGAITSLISVLFASMISAAAGQAALTFVATFLSAAFIPLSAAFFTLMYLDRRFVTEGLAAQLAAAANSR